MYDLGNVTISVPKETPIELMLLRLDLWTAKHYSHQPLQITLAFGVRWLSFIIICSDKLHKSL